MIANRLCVRDRHLLINRLHSYWLLKRHARHGLPLLHRIQYYLLHRVSPTPSVFNQSVKSNHTFI